jgi:hypothetical protein
MMAAIQAQEMQHDVRVAHHTHACQGSGYASGEPDVLPPPMTGDTRQAADRQHIVGSLHPQATVVVALLELVDSLHI